ncbi:MAG: hypothetical protein MJ244_05010 [Clostridia bacterium]|nr:hypothetical protein [Clostridia bacterium]
MKYLQWVLYIVIFAVCMVLNRVWNYALIDGIFAGVLLSAMLGFFLKTVRILKDEARAARLSK